MLFSYYFFISPSKKTSKKRLLEYPKLLLLFFLLPYIILLFSPVFTDVSRFYLQFVIEIIANGGFVFTETVILLFYINISRMT